MWEFALGGVLHAVNLGLAHRREQHDAYASYRNLEKLLNPSLGSVGILDALPTQNHRAVSPCDGCGARQTESKRGRRVCAYCGNDR